MSSRIFVSYRRADTQQAAGRLADDLGQHFGAEKVFRDVENIGLGLDFSDALNHELESCGVMLALIGSRWLSVTDEAGQRRLDNPDDWIRQEIATALRRNIRVVPVLIDGAALPPADALPEELRPLVRRQGLDLADARWRGDLSRLIQTLERLPGFEPLAAAAPGRAAAAPSVPEAPKGRNKLVWWGGGAVAALVLLIAGLNGGGSNEASTAGEGTSAPAATRDTTATPAPGVAPTAAALAALPAEDLAALAGDWRQEHTENQLNLTRRGTDFDVIYKGGGAKVFGQGSWADGALTLRIGQQGKPARPSIECRLSRTATGLEGQCLNADGSMRPMSLIR